MKTSQLLRATKLAVDVYGPTRMRGPQVQMALLHTAHLQRRARRPFPAKAYLRASRRVEVLLGSAQTLREWLELHGHATQAETLSGTGRDKIKTTALAWLDDLIAHFEKRGD